MAARWENDLQGYDVSRFEGEVREDLLCSVCQEVPKDPRLCQHHDHLFCFAHISRHLLQNSKTCPVCRDPLTPETLRYPVGFLKNYLDDLKIKCDHCNRGCPDNVRLENLQRHVKECGYAPVMCGNEGCEMEVNRRDIETHMRDVCQFRIAKCHDCKVIKDNVDHMKHTQAEMKVELNRTNDNIAGLESKQNQISGKINLMKENVAEIKLTQSEMKADQQRFEAEVRKQFEGITEMLNRLLQGSNFNNQANNQNIIILGGYCSPRFGLVLKTVENFNLVDGKSTQLPEMNHARGTPASCVYNNNVIVSGGYVGDDGTDTIEVLPVNQHPLQWAMFGGKLPVKLSGHVTIVYQGKLYIIGGKDWTGHKMSDAIYKIGLTPPYTVKLVAKMFEGRRNHRVELLNGKLFILGGSITGCVTDSVIAYDFITNEFKPCPSLPQPVSGMSTAAWGNMIIVFGGQNQNGQILKEVVSYDTENGRYAKLPSMIYRRRGCSSVIINDVVVVLGGRNDEQGYLNSVETYTMGADGWKELPGMQEKRCWATAVVKPRA